MNGATRHDGKPAYLAAPPRQRQTVAEADPESFISRMRAAQQVTGEPSPLVGATILLALLVLGTLLAIGLDGLFVWGNA